MNGIMDCLEGFSQKELILKIILTKNLNMQSHFGTIWKEKF